MQSIVSANSRKIGQGCVKCVYSGGLGLTGGLVDIGNLYDCLAGIHNGLADDSILDKYSKIRRDKYLNIIDPVSSENLRRLWQNPDQALEVDEFLQMCERASTDPETGKTLQLVSSLGYCSRTQESAED